MNEVKTTYTIHMTDSKGNNLKTYVAARFPAVNDMITDPDDNKSARKILGVLTVNYVGRNYDAMVKVSERVPLPFWPK
jgi:hypothetical protein